MIIQEPVKKKGILPRLQCVICHKDAKKYPKIVKLGSEYGIICDKCGKDFSAQDIELMHNIFIAFGGYFGKLKSIVSSDYKAIIKLIKEYNMCKIGIRASETDVRVFHKALLYGISPRRLIQGIKLLE